MRLWNFLSSFPGQTIVKHRSSRVRLMTIFGIRCLVASFCRAPVARLWASLMLAALMLLPATAMGQSLTANAAASSSKTNMGSSSPGLTVVTVDAPSHWELKKLLKNPRRTAEGERRIAAWYWKEAQHFAKIAQDNMQLADEYASRTRFEPNANYPHGTLSHCRDLAWIYTQKAEAARRVAQQHEQTSIALQASR